MSSTEPTPTFFEKPDDFRKWLNTHHKSEKELWVGFYKVDSGKPSLTWTESVREALCFGWIDGIRKSIGPESYKIRFTPRKPDSIWSEVNIRHVAELIKDKKMQPAGLEAFNKRKASKSGIYSFEQQEIILHPEMEKTFRKNKKAWKNFNNFPPSYKKPAIWWVISAKQELTRNSRLKTLIEDSENGEKIKHLRR